MFDVVDPETLTVTRRVPLTRGDLNAVVVVPDANVVVMGTSSTIETRVVRRPVDDDGFRVDVMASGARADPNWKERHRRRWPVTAVEYLPKLCLVVAGHANGTLAAFELRGGLLRPTRATFPRLHTADVSCIARIGPITVATGSLDHTIRVGRRRRAPTPSAIC